MTLVMRRLKPGFLLGVTLVVTFLSYIAIQFVSESGNNDDQLPDFELETVANPGQPVTAAAISIRPALINVWASWCLACRTEHALLMELAASGRIALYGVNYLDNREDAIRWLAFFGDPYELSVYDSGGRFAAQLGIEVVPGTYLLGQNGHLLYQHVGPLTQTVLEQQIWPRVMAMETDTE